MSACLRCGREVHGAPPQCGCATGPQLAVPEVFERTFVRGPAVADAQPGAAVAEPLRAPADPAPVPPATRSPTGPQPIPLAPSAGDDLPPGTRVGEYEVEGKLGEGAFGSVFSAMQPVIGKRVAVKLLHREIAAVPEMVSRFIAEARAVNQIRHRNIVDIFSFGTLPDGRHYYVMEYLEGRTLAERLAQQGKLGLAELVPILKDIARALAAAHAQGITHRDLKPENVVLAQESDGTVSPKLLDFGIAKLVKADATAGPKTRTGTAMGTASYMSPEQCRGKDIDHRTDIYAFGVMTYELLTGKRPFDGESFVEVAYKHIHELPAPPSSRCPELGGAVDAAVLAMMHKDPDGRPQDITRAMGSLQAALGVPAGSSGPFPAVPLPAQGARPRWPLAVGALVLVAAAAVAGFQLFPRAPPLEEIGPPPPAPPVATKLEVPSLPPEAAAQVEAATVVLAVTGAPAGAQVLGPDGVVLGTVPARLTLPRGGLPVRLKVRAAGYRAELREFTPERDGELKVELQAKKRGKQPSEDDLEEAFQ